MFYSATCSICTVMCRNIGDILVPLDSTVLYFSPTPAQGGSGGEQLNDSLLGSRTAAQLGLRPAALLSDSKDHCCHHWDYVAFQLGVLNMRIPLVEPYFVVLQQACLLDCLLSLSSLPYPSPYYCKGYWVGKGWERVICHVIKQVEFLFFCRGSSWLWQSSRRLLMTQHYLG